MYTPKFLISKILHVFRYLLAQQDSTKYYVINTSTLGNLSEVGEVSDSVFYKDRYTEGMGRK